MVVGSCSCFGCTRPAARPAFRDRVPLFESRHHLVNIPGGRGRGDARGVAATPRRRRGCSVETRSRRRRGGDVEIRGRRRGPVAVMQRLRRGDDARLDWKTFRMKWKVVSRLRRLPPAARPTRGTGIIDLKNRPWNEARARDARSAAGGSQAPPQPSPVKRRKRRERAPEQSHTAPFSLRALCYARPLLREPWRRARTASSRSRRRCSN